MKVLTVVHILLVVGVLVSIVTHNMPLLLTSVVAAAAVGCVWMVKHRPANQTNQANQVRLRETGDAPLRQKRLPKTKQAAKTAPTMKAIQANKANKTNHEDRVVDRRFETLSTQTSRELMKRNLVKNLPEPAGAREASIRAALRHSGLGGATPNMTNVRLVEEDEE
jgi:hypothetical protein